MAHRASGFLAPWNHPRAFIAFAHDLMAATAAWWLAFWLRFSPEMPSPFAELLWGGLPLVVLVQGMCFIAFGLYRGIWRYASLPDLKRLVLTVGVAALVTPAALLLVQPGVVIPRTVLILDPLLLLTIMGGSRLAYRAWKEHRFSALLHPEAKPVLVLGAGSAADFLVRELTRNRTGFRVVGLLDDDPAKQGRRIQDVPVLGRLDTVVEWATRMDVADVILAMPSAPHALRKRLTDLCSQAGLRVLTVPSVEDLMQGRVSVSALRPVELEDLLGREPVVLDDSGLTQCIGGRVVLVTGAAVRSAPSCAGRSPASGRRGWCCSTKASLPSTAWSRSSRNACRTSRWPAWSAMCATPHGCGKCSLNIVQP